MARRLTTLDEITQYLSQVMEKADSHALNVNEIARTVAGAVFSILNKEIYVFERNGDIKNIMWFYTGGKKYVLKYNRNDETIELRANTQRGKMLNSFDNSTPPPIVNNVFATL